MKILRMLSVHKDSTESASRPRWSPDGKILSFLARRKEGDKSQVWTLNRKGGEAQQLTNVAQGISSYEWSPDGKRILLVLKYPKPEDLEKDWNVPILNSEQLYQALRRLGRTTQLVVYPGESHGIRRPSFQKDRYERYLAWYDRYVKGGTPKK